MKAAVPQNSAMRRSPAQPDDDTDEGMDVRNSLRPPTRDYSQRSSQTAVPADPPAASATASTPSKTSSPSDVEIPKKKKKKTNKNDKSKNKKEKGSKNEKDGNVVVEAGEAAAAVGTLSTKTTRDSLANRKATSPTKEGKKVAYSVDDAQHAVAQTDIASVMTDDDDDGKIPEQHVIGKNKKSTTKPPAAARHNDYDDDVKAQSRAAAAASSSTAVSSVSPNNKSRSSGGTQVVNNHDNNSYKLSPKELEKERRNEAMSQMESGMDANTAGTGVTPSTLSRQITPGAFRVQPTSASPPSSAPDVGEGGAEELFDAPPSNEEEYYDNVIDAEAQHVQYHSGLDSDDGDEEDELGQSSRRLKSSTSYDGDNFDDNDDYDNDNPSLKNSGGGDGITAPIVAEIVPTDIEMARRLDAEMKEKVKAEVDARLERERKSQVVAEAVYVDDENGTGRLSKRTKLVGLSVACVVLIIIAVVLGIVVGANTGSSSSSLPSTDAPTSAPTIVATDDFQLMVDRIGDLVSSDPSIFFQGGDSPQFAAMNWLANEDTYETSDDTLILVERYAVAVFYFATTGESWRSSFSFLEPISVCEWHGAGSLVGVTCRYGQYVSSIEMSKDDIDVLEKTVYRLDGEFIYDDDSHTFAVFSVPCYCCSCCRCLLSCLRPKTYSLL
jgi:hypothetical protein